MEPKGEGCFGRISNEKWSRKDVKRQVRARKEPKAQGEKRQEITRNRREKTMESKKKHWKRAPPARRGVRKGREGAGEGRVSSAAVANARGRRACQVSRFLACHSRSRGKFCLADGDGAVMSLRWLPFYSYFLLLFRQFCERSWKGTKHDILAYINTNTSCRKIDGYL